MKWFNLTIAAALLGLFWMTTTSAEPNTAKYWLVSQVNEKIADLTWDSPRTYTSNGAEPLALDQSEATQYYIRNWFGVGVWVMVGLNFAFYAGKASNNTEWQKFKQELSAGIASRTKEKWAKLTVPYNPPKPVSSDTTEVFESV